MKKGILMMMVVLMALLSYGQDWTKIIVGPNKPSKTELQFIKGITAKPMVQAEADAKYNQIISNVNPYLYVYTKHKTDSVARAKGDSIKATISTGSAWQENYMEKGLRLLGSDMIAQTFGISDAGQNSITLTNGNTYYIAIELKKDTIIHGVSTMLQTAGVFTPTYNSFAICLPQSGNFVKVAETATNTAIWTATADTQVKVALTSPYSASKGMIYVAFIYYGTGQTTAPKIYSGGNRAVSINGGVAYGTTYKLISQITSQTTIQNSVASSSTAGITGTPFVKVY
ncbi:MAG: hypothetical protein PHT07_20985 [Paludibacter sp.]|nr:hypothetical protein [Paludibacter sp.]